MTQDLFDSIRDRDECLVASSSDSTNTFMTPVIVHIESLDDEVEPSFEIIESVNDEPELFTDPPANNEPESNNEEATLNWKHHSLHTQAGTNERHVSENRQLT
ncbi:hypothetical protein Glove_54g31 [Diversispora epigaea]|uniref:Uncharacterized protein n=1 Tax=Diversispora epigaea TaxID=1348612 RepID=A0A397JJG1_9GLOM|nr:hypothetical protein Glove_54g31 [Diversispora epigaea]